MTSLFLAGISGSLMWRAFSGPDEPVYEGRPLTSWLDHHVASSAANPPYGSPGWKEADEAIRHIGTNAIPTLLEMIRAEDRPPLVRKLIDSARHFGLPLMKYRPPTMRHEEAEYAFEMLGTNAVAAVPELVRIYDQEISPSSQRCAARSLGHMGRGAHAALTALIGNFTHTNADVRFHAVSAVADIGGQPDVVVPALTSALKDPNVNVRWNALSGLSRFGGRARSAAPEIVKMLDDPVCHCQRTDHSLRTGQSAGGVSGDSTHADTGRKMRPDKPAGGNPGIASWLTISRYWPGAPQPGRSAQH